MERVARGGHEGEAQAVTAEPIHADSGQTRKTWLPMLLLLVTGMQI